MTSPAHAPADATDADSADGTDHRDPHKRHRHDVGEVDHGPVSSVKTTRAIQVLLGLWIFLTLALVIWAMATPRPQPAPRQPQLQPNDARSAGPTAGAPPH